ncbi:MAG: ABC transporter ATP-binding protein [Paracoccaceae bacterium]
MSLLAVRDLTVALPPGADRAHAVEGVSFELAAGEILCVVGESGSGKSVSANAIMGLLPEGLEVVSGRIDFDGRDLLSLSEAQMMALRGRRVSMVFQEPMSALNPLMRVGAQIAEAFEAHGALAPRERRARALALLDEVGIPEPETAIRAHPHQLSGGQRQRVTIAMALALEPQILIADEPTTALDVTTQAQILALIEALRRRRGMGVLFVTHDFGVVADIADRVVVMRAGRIVEAGRAEEVLRRPRHPYTRALIDAIPRAAARAATGRTGAPILAVERLSKTFTSGGGLGRARRVVHAVRDASFELIAGETVGIVGESGSGKSTLGRCVVRLTDPTAGRVLLGGTDIAALRGRALRDARRRVQMIFQDPFSSLNPRARVGRILTEGPVAHGTPRPQARARAREILEMVGLDPGAMDRFPHEFSGGQRQRVGIARALMLDPEVIVADEAVSALDVQVQAQVLALLADLKSRLGLSMLFVTHDLRVAAAICDRILVMQRGRIVEAGPAARVLSRPETDYARSLLDAIPGRAREHAPGERPTGS